jgi:hypothetical protein
MDIICLAARLAHYRDGLFATFTRIIRDDDSGTFNARTELRRRGQFPIRCL